MHQKKEKSLPVSVWPSLFLVCSYFPDLRQEHTYSAPERTSDEERRAHKCTDGCTPFTSRIIQSSSVEKWKFYWRESRSYLCHLWRRSQFYVMHEQFGQMGLWDCHGVVLRAKKNVTADTWSISKKKVGQSGYGGRHSSLLQLKFDDTKRIWKIQTVTAARGSACTHPCKDV